MSYQWADLISAHTHPNQSEEVLLNRLSDYIRKYDGIIDGYTVLFHTRTKEILAIQKEYVDDNYINEIAPKKILKTLEQKEFFLSKQEEQNKAYELSIDDNLIISIELSHKCNLKCPYCYQNYYNKSYGGLNKEDIDKIINYCQKAFSIKKPRKIIFKILGGEPLIEKEKLSYLASRINEVRQTTKAETDIIIDTNGTIDLIGISNLFPQNLRIRVPLCERSYHNLFRNFNNQGTFDVIIDNLNKVYQYNPNIEIVLRHNTDSKNIILYDTYLTQLKESAIFPINIELAYVLNFTSNTFKNELDYSDFVKWKSSEAIITAIKNKVPVMQAPLMNYRPCQYCSDFSMKFCADRTVRICPSTNIKGTVDNISNKSEFKLDNCYSCSSYFLCGGVMKLPCMKELGFDMETCNKYEAENHALNLETYLKTFINALQNGNEGYFIKFLGKK